MEKRIKGTLFVPSDFNNPSLSFPHHHHTRALFQKWPSCVAFIPHALSLLTFTCCCRPLLLSPPLSAPANASAHRASARVAPTTPAEPPPTTTLDADLLLAPAPTANARLDHAAAKLVAAVSYNLPTLPPEILARIIECLFSEEVPLDRSTSSLDYIRDKERLSTINTCTHVCRVFRYLSRPLYFQSVELGINKRTSSGRRFDRLLQMTSSADSSDSNSDSILRHIRHLCVNMERTPPGELMQHLSSDETARRISFLLNIPNLRSLSLRFSKRALGSDQPSTPEATALCNRLVESYLTSTTAILQSLQATKIHGLPYERIFACKTLYTLSLDRCPWPVLKNPIPQLTSLSLKNMPTKIPLDSLFCMPNLTELCMEQTFFERNRVIHDSPTHTSSSQLTLPYGLSRIHLSKGEYQFETLHTFLQRHKHSVTTEPLLPLLQTISVSIFLNRKEALVPYLRALPPLQSLSIRVTVPWASMVLFSSLNLDAHLSTGGQLSSLAHLSIELTTSRDNNPALLTLFMSFCNVFSSITPGTDNNLRCISITLGAAFEGIRNPHAVVVSGQAVEPTNVTTTSPLVEVQPFWMGLTGFMKNCSNLPRLQKVTLNIEYYQSPTSQDQRLAPEDTERAYAFHLERHVESDRVEDRSLIESICRMHHDLMETNWQTDSNTSTTARRRPTGFRVILGLGGIATIVVTFSAEG
ncbi:hypothetical protein CVT24_002377 [Panaeolus cyanescens]|uniref:F-box domain-containing protein n=1 Tax=Panaeolus cyanescens TaxID=181874 RepID=A0A409WXF1_9AGAR|nr:hypothetical protein CVT24_002377 [Panaeolus cyanescens]